MGYFFSVYLKPIITAKFAKHESIFFISTKPLFIFESIEKYFALFAVYLLFH